MWSGFNRGSGWPSFHSYHLRWTQLTTWQIRKLAEGSQCGQPLDCTIHPITPSHPPPPEKGNKMAELTFTTPILPLYRSRCTIGTELVYSSPHMGFYSSIWNGNTLMPAFLYGIVQPSIRRRLRGNSSPEEQGNCYWNPSVTNGISFLPSSLPLRLKAEHCLRKSTPLRCPV